MIAFSVSTQQPNDLVKGGESVGEAHLVIDSSSVFTHQSFESMNHVFTNAKTIPRMPKAERFRLIYEEENNRVYGLFTINNLDYNYNFCNIS
jgi:hypothetical protein